MVSHSVLSSSKTPNWRVDKLGFYLNFARVAKKDGASDIQEPISKNNAMCENVPRGFWCNDMYINFLSEKAEAFVLRSYVTFELGAVVRTQIGFPPIPPVHKHTGWGV